ncbi:hypothetical protein FE257_008941 [Aspergillus nanangensis]|uniref:Uncharacterized protein n=1 Tax=Aspergillus nanangensis TaxID=2582783 RepID=A0AAD4CWF2_ASPNN|nr:hypothetical protein FE257_008941 [Aspergillus nanangensis]
MTPKSFSLEEVLAIAPLHPFYDARVEYPPSAEDVKRHLQSVVKDERSVNFLSQPLLLKKSIYTAVDRLLNDASLQNTYRQSSYLSITGGGSGSVPMLFAVDVHENRQQRIQMGKFIRLCGLVSPGDWILSTHVSGGFYRSLDLMTEILENAGATVLSGGNSMPPSEVIQTLKHYHVNVLTGDGSQVIQVVYHISMLSPADRTCIKLNKIIYTSEPLANTQRAFIRATLGEVKICSVLGSAEAGPWAISNPDLTGEEDCSGGATDFVFDTRSMLIETFSTSLLDAQGQFTSDSSCNPPSPLPPGQAGLVVQTSLQRLRNPLVRYNTGDIGSVGALPESAKDLVPDSERQYIRVLRMQGRDRRFSFKWYGVYIEFENVKALMQKREWGILQWQIILDCLPSSPQVTLELRLLRVPTDNGEFLPEEDLIGTLRNFFLVLPENEHLFQITLVKNLSGFERSSTAGKVITFIDRVH